MPPTERLSPDSYWWLRGSGNYEEDFVKLIDQFTDAQREGTYDRAKAPQ
jgi:hypothetical protein